MYISADMKSFFEPSLEKIKRLLKSQLAKARRAMPEGEKVEVREEAPRCRHTANDAALCLRRWVLRVSLSSISSSIRMREA